MEHIHKYGWKRQIGDRRDFKYSALRLQKDLLPIIDLEPFCSPVYDQKSLGSCHDDITEVLTDRGFVLFKELLNNDKLATVDILTKNLIFEKPKRLIKIKYNGNMIYGRHQRLDFFVTPDHKMLIREWDGSKRTLKDKYNLIDAKDIGWYCGLLNSVNYIGINNDKEYILPGVDHKLKSQRLDKKIRMDLWLRFLGIYLAEGTMAKPQKTRSCYKIQFAASKNREREFIHKLLLDMGFNPCVLKDRFTITNKQVYTELKRLGLFGIKAPFKFIPDFVFDLPSDMIKNILYGHFMGDGCEQDGSVSHYTSSKRLADDLQRLVFLSGGWSNIYIREPRTSIMKDGRKVIGKYPEYHIFIWKYKNGSGISIDKKENITIQKYNGFVYCAEMPTYHTLVTRRNSKILISGNCTSQGIGFIFEYEHTKQFKDEKFMPSRLFIYYVEREIEDTINEDAGAIIRDGLKVVANKGVCPEDMYPYDITKFTNKPSDECYAEALKHQVLQYLSINQNLYDLKSCLAEGYPFVFGISVYESFESKEVAKTGIVNMPWASERMLGGHAIACVGYNDFTKQFKIRNSWGKDWGQNGYCFMPYDYLTSPDLASDFWSIRLVE